MEEEKLKLDVEKTQLAVERTLLASIRTGLTAIGLGIAISKFLIFQTVEKEKMGYWAGQLLVLWGIGWLIFSLVSYRRCYLSTTSFFSSRDFTFKGLTVGTLFLIAISLFLFFIMER